jgi:hypothetical protein
MTDDELDRRLRHIEAQLIELRNELDGHYQITAGRVAGWEGVARIVSEQGRRITALERK